MQYIVDFHIHSKYSRATSKNMDLAGIDEWSQKKGIEVVATADFTHPLWFRELKENLVEIDKSGLYVLKNTPRSAYSADGSGKIIPTHFICSTELSCIYKKNDKVRRIHLLVLAPNLETVAEINKALGAKYNIKSDGRPILGIHSEKLAELLFKINPEIMIIPAHIWTPWFALFGSKSGFDTFEECFEEYSDKIYAVETGLSSDPAMNWLISQIDSRTLISNSDAHSGENLGREANVFSGDKISYQNITESLKNQGKGKELNLNYTIEFFPEEGKYHFDGHRDCGVVMHPNESRQNNNICPKCKRPLTIGVHNRVYELADRDESYDGAKRIPFKKIVPLKEIIAEVVQVGKSSKKVSAIYEEIIRLGKNEFNVLLNLDLVELKGKIDDDIILAIELVRQEKVKVEPGYDGEYGKINIDLKGKIKEQSKLF